MKLVVWTVVLTGLLLSPALGFADGFDCANPPFGQDVVKIEGMQRYKQGGQVSYYRYIGNNPCKLAVHKYATPVIAYGVVDGKLYSRIIGVAKTPKTEKIYNSLIEYLDGGIDRKGLHEFWTETMQKFQDSNNMKIKEEGDSIQIVWKLKPKDLRGKAKVDVATGFSKVTLYYLPLWEQLKKQ